MTPLGNQGISSQQAGQPTKQVHEKTTHEDSVADHVGQEILHTGNGSPSAMHEHTTLNKIPLPQGNNSTFEEGAVNEMVSHCHDQKTSEVSANPKLEELKGKKETLERKIEKQEQFIEKLRTFALAKKDLIQKKNDLLEVGNRKADLEKDKNELKNINEKIEVLSKYNQEEEDSQDWDDDLKEINEKAEVLSKYNKEEEDSQDWDDDLRDIHDQLAAAKANESMINDSSWIDSVNDSFQTAEKEKNINKELKVSASQVETAPSEQTLGEKLSSYVDDVTEGISNWMSSMFSSAPEASGAEVSPKNEKMMQKQNEIKEDIQSMKDNIEILQSSTGSGEEVGETIKEEAESITTKFFSFCEDAISSAADHATQLAKDFENILDQISHELTSEESDATEAQKPIKEEISALESHIESLNEEVSEIKENHLKLMDINISQTINRVRTSSASVNKMIQNEISNSALSSEAIADLQEQSEETDQAIQLELKGFDLEGQMNAITENLTAQHNSLSKDIYPEANLNSLSENLHLESRITPKKFNGPPKDILPGDNPNRLFENTPSEANAASNKSFFEKMRNFSHTVTNYVDDMISTHNRPLGEKTEPTLSQKISKKIYNTDMSMRSAVENRTEIKELSTLRNEYDILKQSMDDQMGVLKNRITQAQTEGSDISGLQEGLRIQIDANRYRKISFLETILSKEQEIEKFKRPNLASDLNYNDHVKVKEGMRFNRLENINVSDLDKGISYLQSRSDKKPNNTYLKELIGYYEEIRAAKDQPQA